MLYYQITKSMMRRFKVLKHSLLQSELMLHGYGCQPATTKHECLWTFCCKIITFPHSFIPWKNSLFKIILDITSVTYIRCKSCCCTFYDKICANCRIYIETSLIENRRNFIIMCRTVYINTCKACTLSNIFPIILKRRQAINTWR